MVGKGKASSQTYMKRELNVSFNYPPALSMFKETLIWIQLLVLYTMWMCAALELHSSSSWLKWVNWMCFCVCVRDIQKVASSELLTKQAMWRSTSYILNLKLLLYVLYELRHLYLGTSFCIPVWKKLTTCKVTFWPLPSIHYYCWSMGACGSVVVKALCYKPEGRGFDTQWGDF
jgi:hypothetical protein